MRLKTYPDTDPLRNRRGQRHSFLPRESFRLTLQANAVPQFQLQQPPDAIVVVAILCAMLGKKTLDRFAPEVPTLQASRTHQQLFDSVQPGAGEPSTPRSWKPQFAAVKNRVGKQVFNRLFQNDFFC